MILYSPLSPALGLGGPVSSQASTRSLRNLLLWSEALDNAAWVKTNAIVTANLDGRADQGEMTAASGVVSQITGIAASTGAAATTNYTLTADYARVSVTGTFDGIQYTFSGEVKEVVTGEIRFQITRSGGFIQCIVRDTGDGITFLGRDFQLEVGSAFTTYEKREGA